MLSTIALLLTAALLVQGKSVAPRDAIDDMIAAGLATLKSFEESTDSHVRDIRAMVTTTVLYYTHTIDTFLADGNVQAQESLTLLGDRSHELTLEAISNGKPNAVTCIANHLDTGNNNINSAITKLEGDLRAAGSKDGGTFSSSNTTLNLLLDTIPDIYKQNSPNLETCVTQVCIDSNLAVAKGKYDTVDTTATKIEDDVRKLKNDFNQKSVDLLHEARFKILDEEANQIKQMEKC